MKKIITLISDSYKYSMWRQYPGKTEYITSYIEARGYDTKLFTRTPDVVFIGLDWFIQDYLQTPITHDDIDYAKKLIHAHGEPFIEDGWRRIVNEHSGYLPLKIEALPEGSITRPGIPLVQVTNTDPKCWWLTTFIETALLRAIWYPTTVATLSRECKVVIDSFLAITGDQSLLPFKLHDFGARGVSSHESAMIGGAAHLVNFMGTDTFEAVTYLYDKYGEVYGFSIPASEHSTITSWGRDHEVQAFENMIDVFDKPNGLVACVSDSYNIYEACRELWGTKLKDKVLSMKGGLVVRPDSGDPLQVTLDVIEILGEKFGYTVNDKGFRVLNPKVRIIQGDGVNLVSITRILRNYAEHGWSADNIAFGMGAALLQNLNRDSLKFAMKANEAVIEGVAIDVYKDPITDHGKHSKKGKQGVYRNAFGELEAWPVHQVTSNIENLLEVRYRDGAWLRPAKFTEIRERAKV